MATKKKGAKKSTTKKTTVKKTTAKASAAKKPASAAKRTQKRVLIDDVKPVKRAPKTVKVEQPEEEEVIVTQEVDEIQSDQDILDELWGVAEEPERLEEETSLLDAENERDLFAEGELVEVEEPEEAEETEAPEASEPEDEPEEKDEDEPEEEKKPKKEQKMSKKDKPEANKALKITSWIMVGLGTLALGALVGYIVYRQVLPVLYMSIMIGAAAVVAVILILLVMGRKKKTVRRIIAMILSLLLIAGSIFGFYKVNEIFSFLDKNLGTGAGVEVAEESWIMYISGIDTRDNDLPEKSRSDLNILAVVNPNTHKVLLVNIPRDYYIEVPGMSGTYDKLTHMGEIGGLSMSTQAIENLLDIKINSATRVNFNLLEGLVDSIGGITIDSDTAHGTYWNENCWINAGANELDGECAVAYARERLSVGGDLARAESQEQVIEAVLEKISSDKSILLNYSSILDALDGTFETNLSSSDVMDLVRGQLSNMKGWQTEEMNVEPAGQGMEYTYTFPDSQKFVYYVNENSVKEVHDKIVSFMAER